MLRWFLVLFLVATTCLSILAKEPYGLAVIDETGRLDRAVLERAAQPLLGRGAAIAVVLVKRGGQPDAVKQLSQLGLLADRQISPAGLFVYVSLQPRYSELRAGSRFSDDLPAGRLETIRDQILNPRLREENFQQGYSDSLQELERNLAHSLSLKDWLTRATLAFIALSTLYLMGFWDWFSDTPPGRFLLWLWSLTPVARARQRRETEQARLGQLRLLQASWDGLERTRQNSPALDPTQTAELASLQEQVQTASPWSATQLVELRTRVEAENSNLERLQRCRTAGGNELLEAQQLFQSVRSRLKDRKKTRALLQSPEIQTLEAELKQESELRQRYSDQGASYAEWEQSQFRCRSLLQRTRELAESHGIPRRSQAQPSTQWSAAASQPESSNTSSSSSSYDDRSSSYDPPSSSSESWAGGDW